MSDESLRAEDAADATSSPEAPEAPEVAEPSEEHLNEASPDDAAGAADPQQAAAQAPAPDEPDYQDQFLRARAELENVRKRARRDVAAAQDRGMAKLAKELLPAIDDLERALEHAAADDPLRAGVKAVLDRMLAGLAKVGIELDAPAGEAFDPHRHEAIAQQPVEGAATGTIVQVYSNGYRLGDDVLRAAKVVVAA